MERDRFRYSDNHWWYQTREGDWLYERDGRWYRRGGRPYTGFEAYNAGYRHPNYRYHDDHWWYYTGNDWVFYRNGNWYYGDGRFYAPRRPDFTFAAGPVRLNILMANDGRRYRYHDDHWWYRDNGSWFYLRDGWWYHESGRRDHDAEPGIREQLRTRYENMQRVRRQRTAEADAEIAGDIETATAPWPAPPAPETREDRDQPVAALEAELPDAPQAPPLTAQRDEESRIEVGDEIPTDAELEGQPGRTSAPRELTSDADAEEGEDTGPAETVEPEDAEGNAGDTPAEPGDAEPAAEDQPEADEAKPGKETGEADAEAAENGKQDVDDADGANRVEQPTPGEGNPETSSDKSAPQKP